VVVRDDDGYVHVVVVVGAIHQDADGSTRSVVSRFNRSRSFMATRQSCSFPTM
jgi:hypothetical protein